MARASASDRRYHASSRLRNFTAIPNEVLRSTNLSGNAKALYAILLDIVLFQRDEPDLTGLGGLLGGGEKTARSAVKELEDGDLLVARRRGRGMPNAYELLEPPEGRVKNGPEGGSRQAPADGLASSIEDDPSGPSKTGDDHAQICAAWVEKSPPLISHRETYFADAKVKRATARALRVYPAEVVLAAVANYATCLGDGFRWSYRWTLVDFLTRGLDKFVPEADPLRNYRDYTRTARDGEQQIIDDLPDL